MQQQRDARLLVELEVFGPRHGGGEQFGDAALVNVGILPQIQRREMEAEQVDRAPQRPQTAARENRAAVGLQRMRDHGEIGAEFLHGLVSGGVVHRMA